MVHVILSQVLGVWYVLKRVNLTFGCQEMGFSKSIAGNGQAWWNCQSINCTPHRQWGE